MAQAIGVYQEALSEAPREKLPLTRARIQNNLGSALATLGERESGTARLEEAVAAYREALKEYTRKRVPLDWATTQNNLGLALGSLGERESGTARLEEALSAYESAASVFREAGVLQYESYFETRLQSLRGLIAQRFSHFEKSA